MRSPFVIERLRGLEIHLAEVIKGQSHILSRISSVLRRGELDLAHPRRPRGSLLLIGPTGVGKTETAKVFTSYLMDGLSPVRFDMSEYQLQGSVDKLIGENRSDAGLLGCALRGVKRGTLLFDEIEKAHVLVLDLLLQILEDARITLATGEELDLSKFYVVCTSNIGSEETMRMENVPFASVERAVLMRVRERLRPELQSRINEIVVYSRLSYPIQRQICEAMVIAERRRLAALGHSLEIDAGAIEFLVRAGYHRTLGARPMRGTVERYLQDAVTSDLLLGGGGSGRVVVDKSEALLLLIPNSRRAGRYRRTS